jgi:hypothetical protein
VDVAKERDRRINHAQPLQDSVHGTQALIQQPAEHDHRHHRRRRPRHQQNQAGRRDQLVAAHCLRIEEQRQSEPQPHAQGDGHRGQPECGVPEHPIEGLAAQQLSVVPKPDERPAAPQSQQAQVRQAVMDVEESRVDVEHDKHEKHRRQHGDHKPALTLHWLSHGGYVVNRPVSARRGVSPAERTDEPSPRLLLLERPVGIDGLEDTSLGEGTCLELQPDGPAVEIEATGRGVRGGEPTSSSPDCSTLRQVCAIN